MAPMEDCTCPICLCILIEPVTMPCKHSICFPCYKQTVEKANLCCPLCRLRISVWARKSAKAGSLIDEAKWAAIKKEFPLQVQKRLEGKETLDDDNDLENYETRLRQLMAVSKPGEIREEYEAELEKLQRRRQEEAKMEEEASAVLIRSLQEEMEREREAEARLKEEQDMLDREVAEKLQETFVSEDEAVFSETEAFSKSLSTLEGGSKLLDKKAASKIKRGKGKQLKQASSNNLTMATFFSPVPRETGPTSPISGNMTPRKLHMDSCDSADLRLHTIPCDKCSALETKGLISSSVHCLKHKHPEVNVLVKAGGSLEDQIVGGGGVVCGTNLDLETSDRLAAGPSGLGRYGTVTSSRELKTQIPAKDAKDFARSKHADTMPQRQLLGIFNGVSSTPVSSCSVSDHSGNLLAAGVRAGHLGLASSRVRSSEMSSLSIRNETFNSGGPQLQTQPVQSSDTAEGCSGDRKALLPHRKKFENFNADVKSSIPHGGAKLDSQDTLLADPEAVDPSCKNRTTASDHVKRTVDPAFRSSILNKVDDRLTESGDGTTQKCNGTVNGWALDDDDVHANDSDDSIISCYNDLSDSDSWTDFSENLVPSRQETLPKPPLEKQFKTCLAKSKFNSEKENRIGIDSEQYKDVNINFQVKDHHQRLNPTVKIFRVKTHSAKKPKKSTVESGLGKKTEPVVSIMRWCVPNNESENGLQTKNAVVDKLEPRLKYNASVFVDKFEQSHRNSPGVFVYELEPRHRNDPSVFVEKLEPRHRNDPYVFVDELEPRDRNDPNVFVDKLEQRHRNNQGVLNYFGKRKNTTGDNNKKEHVFDDSKRSNDIHNVKRENCVASDSNECSRKKRCKTDSVVGSSASVGQETSAVDVIDLDDVDLTEMSQEELDHLMAVRLQEMYSSLDKKNIAVDRFKGSKDQYMLRKKSARK